MENKIFIPLVLAICVLLITGLYFLMKTTPEIKDCKDIQNKTEKIQCYKKLLNKTQNSSICENIQEPEIKDTCYLHLAFLKKDKSICDTKVSSDIKEKCYSRIAISKNNLELCENLSEKDSILQCYTNFAIQKNNSSYCEKLGFFTTREPIYSIFNSRKIYGTQKDYCYYKFADYGRRNLEKEKIDECGEIKNIDIKNTCYTEFAQTFKNRGFCNNLKSKALYEDCIEITNLGADNDFSDKNNSA